MYNVYIYAVFLFTQGRGRVEAERRATVHKAGSKIPT
jgi:hypothetical protein